MPAGPPLHALLTAAASRTPDAVAIHPRGDRPGLTHAGLTALADALAAALAEDGVAAGDRVLTQLVSSPTALALHLACLHLGAVHVPVDVGLTDSEILALVADADPRVVVRPSGRSPLGGVPLVREIDDDGACSWLGEAGAAPEPAVRSWDDVAAILYTSGTTGRPKGVMLTHRNLVTNVENLTAAWGFTAADVLVHTLPLSHTHGLFVAAACVLASGASMHLLPRFEADEVVALLPRSTVVMGVPTHWTRLLAHPGFDREAAARLRLLTSGSAPLLAATHEAIRERTGHVVVERYGMTETSILTTNPLGGPCRAGTVGRPLPGVDVRLADDEDVPLHPGDARPADVVGGVQVRGTTVFAGYWQRPGLAQAETTADGWFRTGDLGRWDAAGYLELVGRAKDLVISGGLNVYPPEIEAMLDALPGVAESAVVGLPDDDLGERVVAVVVAEPGATLDPEAVRRSARAHLAGHKAPKQVVVVSALPRNTLGKVEKARLRADL